MLTLEARANGAASARTHHMAAPSSGSVSAALCCLSNLSYKLANPDSRRRSSLQMSESYLSAGARRHADFSSLLGREPVSAPPAPTGPEPRLHTFSFSGEGNQEPLHVQLLLLGETLYVWVGDAEARFEALSVAMPGIGGARPNATTLMGSAAEGYGQILSQRLAAKLCRTVLVSYSAREDPALRLAIEARVLRELQSHFAGCGLQLEQRGTPKPIAGAARQRAAEVAAPKSPTAPPSAPPSVAATPNVAATTSEPPAKPVSNGGAQWEALYG